MRIQRQLTIILLFCSTTLLGGDKYYFYHTDNVGTPLAITDDKGVIVWKCDYRPFGEVQNMTGSIENNRQFIGKEKDAETGLHSVKLRYFADQIGRFISPDIIGPVNPADNKINNQMLEKPQLINRYAYSLNNPYRFLDSNGKWPTEVHNRIINNALSDEKYGLTPNDIEAIQKGSRFADTFQKEGESYMHSMRAYEGQSVEKAQQLRSDYITKHIQLYKFFLSRGERETAFFMLGMAMHPIMDESSPSHLGWQTMGKLPSDIFFHLMNESNDVFENSDRLKMEAFETLRKFYEENR